MELTRTELTQVAPVVGISTCQLLPMGKHKTQRVVVGDSHGDVLCFSMKKGASKTQWRVSLTNGSNESESNSAGGKRSVDNDRDSMSAGGGSNPIFALDLAGDRGDKVFVSQKSGITGLNRKGTVFYSFSPPISDPVTSFSVSGNYLHAASRYSYTLFRDSQEMFHAMSPGQIDSMLRLPVSNGGVPSERDPVVLGCSDRMVRLLQGSPEYKASLPVGGMVTALASQDKGKDSDIFYGLHNGTIGTFSGIHKVISSSSEAKSSSKSAEGKSYADPGDSPVAESEDSGTFKRGWTLDNSGSFKINSLRVNNDLLQDGTDNLIVGGDDGTIQIYGFGLDSNINPNVNSVFGTPDASGASSSSSRSSRPLIRFQQEVGESLRSIDVGQVNAPGFDEVVISTFTGRVCSFTTESMSATNPGDKYGRSKLKLRNEGLIVETKKEIEGLRKQINKEMTKVQGISKKLPKQARANMEKNPNFNRYHNHDIVHQFHTSFDPESASYICRVELATAIDYVVLSGDIVGVQIKGTDSACGDVIINFTKPHVMDATSSNAVDTQIGSGGSSSITATGKRRALLATLRPSAAGTTRVHDSLDGDAQDMDKSSRSSTTKVLEWRVQPIEGQHGDINIIVVTHISEHSSLENNGNKALSIHSQNMRQALELKMSIKPLSLHQRIDEENSMCSEDKSLPEAMSRLNVMGNFSAERAYKWLLRMLPDISPRFSGPMSMRFRNTYIKSTLQIMLTDSKLEFVSDNISTLAIARDIIAFDLVSSLFSSSSESSSGSLSSSLSSFSTSSFPVPPTRSDMRFPLASLSSDKRLLSSESLSSSIRNPVAAFAARFASS